MVDINTAVRPSTVKDLILIIMVLIILVIGSFVWMFHGAPIHDLRLWMLEQRFTHANINHPSGSVLLARRSFLGGPSTHGSGQCVYATGEVRRTTLDQDDILSAYKNTRVGRFPLEVYFTDQSELPYEVPFGDWQDGLENVRTSGVYIVYASVISPYFGDLRCDS